MIPRNEHPNPNFKRNDYIILNGEWDFEFDFGNSGKERNLFAVDADFSKKINVPFCPESELSGIEHVDFIPAVWYRRKINITENSILGSPKYVPYEDINLPIPENHDQYLKYIYGDYMKIPSKEEIEAKTHTPYILDLKKPQNKNKK